MHNSLVTFLEEQKSFPCFSCICDLSDVVVLFHHYFSVISTFLYASCVDAAVFMTMKLGVLMTAGL